MRSLGCLYLVVVKSAVAAVAGPTTVGGIAVVLVSAGLVGVLLKAELETALAHPANGDSRAMGTALGPVPVATLKRPNNACERPETDLRERSAAVIESSRRGAGRLDRSVLHPPPAEERVKHPNSLTKSAETS